MSDAISQLKGPMVTHGPIDNATFGIIRAQKRKVEWAMEKGSIDTRGPCCNMNRNLAMATGSMLNFKMDPGLTVSVPLLYMLHVPAAGAR